MKRWILIISLIILLLICMIIFINIGFKKENNQTDINENELLDMKEISKSIKSVSTKDEFYMVKNCINKFYIYYSSIYTGEIETDDEKETNLQAIYNMLSPEYIKFKNITKENILEKLNEEKGSKIDITQMYVSNYNIYISRYFVKGTLMDNEKNISDFYVMLEVDSLNKTFAVFLEDYINLKYSNIIEGQEIGIEFNEQIEKNTYNIYEISVIGEETYVMDLFGNYRDELLYNKELAYSKLNVEYKNLRFENIGEFEKYLKENRVQHFTMKVEKYKKEIVDSYTQYVCIDNLDNYYIFRETSPMNYTVILDTYTIDLPEFIEKYESSSEEEKVLLNLQKCFEAINNKDYNYVYNKLDETFKANNFATLEKFEQYIRQITFETNSISSSNGKVQGDIYMYDLTISDKTGENTNTFKKTFLMKLNEGTDFVMSFNL